MPALAAFRSHGASLPVWALLLLKGAELVYDQSGRASANRQDQFCGRALESCEERLVSVSTLAEVDERVCRAPVVEPPVIEEERVPTAVFHGLLASLSGIGWTCFVGLVRCCFRKCRSHPQTRHVEEEGGSSFRATRAEAVGQVRPRMRGFGMVV